MPFSRGHKAVAVWRRNDDTPEVKNGSFIIPQSGKQYGIFKTAFNQVVLSE